jgi:trehalose-6-phosphate synthase
MPLEERRQRHEALFKVIYEKDIKAWGELFLAALTQESDLPTWHEQPGLQPPMNPGLLKLPQ